MAVHFLMSRLCLLLLFVVASSCATLDVYRDFKVPSGWKMVRKADARDRLTLHIAVKQQNLDFLQVRLFFHVVALVIIILYRV